MKKYKVFGLVLLFIVQACGKFLEVQPRDAVFEEEVFAYPVGVYSVMNGRYQELASAATYGYEMTFGTIDIMAQYMPGKSENQKLFSNYSYSSNSETGIEQVTVPYWNKVYTMILDINNAIQKMEDPGFDVVPAHELNTMLGELYGLRAFLHFDLLRFFGPVYRLDPDKMAIPYMTKADGNLTAILPANEVIDLLHADVEKALGLLESDPIREDFVNPADGNENGIYSNRNYRMNYYAVTLLAARIYLWEGRNEEAFSYANQLIDEASSNFPFIASQGAARQNPAFSSEVLFGLENRDLHIHHRDYFSSSVAEDVILAPLPQRLQALYNNNNDFRYVAWTAPGTEGDKPYRVFVKYASNLLTPELLYFQPLMKISEAYLIAAECSASVDEALRYLNRLRVNRGLNALSSGLSKAEITTGIVDEYAREFWGEGQLFFAYKRLNLPQIQSNSGTPRSMSPLQYEVPIPRDELRYR